jgi:hypothetical protein
MKQWQMLLHNIMVEILVLQKARRPAGQVCYPRNPRSDSWMRTRTADIKPSATGSGVNVTFSGAESEAEILRAIPDEMPEQQAPDQYLLFRELEQAVAVSDYVGQATAKSDKNARLPPAWMDVSINHPGTKMAVSPALRYARERLANL